MRKKITASFDAVLYERVKEWALREGRSLSSLLEEALSQYLERDGQRPSVVRETAGVLQVPVAVVREATEASLYDDVDT